MACPGALFPLPSPCFGARPGGDLYCTRPAICACPDGLSGVSDFALGAPTCLVSAQAVRALYSLLAVSAAVVLGGSLGFLRRLTRTRQTSMHHGSGRALVVVASLSAAAALCFILVGVLRAAHPDKLGATIGSDPLITVLFSLGAALWWLHATIMASLIIESSAKQLRAQGEAAYAPLRRSMVIFFKLIRVLGAAAAFFALVPVLLLATQDATTWYWLTLTHIVGLTGIAISMGLFLRQKIFPALSKGLANAITEGKALGKDVSPLERARIKVDHLSDHIRNQAIFNLVLATPFGVLPGLQNIAAYWEPIAFTCAMIISVGILFFSWPSPRSSPSSPRARPSHRGSFVTVGKTRHRIAQSLVEGNAIRVGVVGLDGSESTVDAFEAERVLNTAQVLSDSNGIVNVRTKNIRVFQTQNTLLGRYARGLNKKLLKGLRSWMAMGHVAVVLPLMLFVIVAVVIGVLSALEIISSLWCILYIIPIVLYSLAAASFWNLEVMALIVRTSFFWVRFTSALVTCVALCLVFTDARLCIALALFVLQTIVAAGDGCSGELAIFRVVLLAQLIVVLVFVEVFIFFDLIPYTYYTVAVPTTNFDWAFIQLARDLSLGTLLITCFDLSFALRGSQRRFATIHDPIKFVLRTFADSRENWRGGSALVVNSDSHNASKLQIHSGYLATTPSAATGAEVKIFVDTIAISQHDAIVVHLAPDSETGERWFHYLDSSLSARLDVIVALLLLFVWGVPWLPQLVWATLPMIVYFAPRRFLMSSRSMLRLLLQRRTVQVQIVFLSLWGGLFIVVFPNELALLAIVFMAVSLTELFKDATLRKRSRLSVVRTKFLAGLFAMYFHILMIFNVFGSIANHYYVDFRPDTYEWRLSNSSVPYSDDGCVVDLYQQTIDLGLSLGLGHLLTGIYLLIFHKVDELSTVHRPVVPEYEDDDKLVF